MLDAGFMTVDDIKARLLPEAGTDDTQWDAALCGLGRAVAVQLQRHCNRTLERAVGAAEEYSAQNLAITLRAYPVESIDRVELLVNTGAVAGELAGYSADLTAGVVYFSRYPGGNGRLRITYTGGFWLDDGEEKPAGAVAMPDDILEAFLAQCQATARGRNLFGAVSLADPKTAAAAGDMLPEVAEALRTYRRFSGE